MNLIECFYTLSGIFQETFFTILPYSYYFLFTRLILETEIENVDVKTEDPFDSANPNNPWKITIVNQKVNENLFSSMNKLVE